MGSRVKLHLATRDDLNLAIVAGREVPVDWGLDPVTLERESRTDVVKNCGE